MFAKCWKNLKLGTNKLNLDFELLPKTIEIDADLAQNDM